MKVRLARSENDRLLAGVAGGLAQTLAMDAAVIRLAFVVLGAAGGAGLVLYLFLWLILPERTIGSGEAERIPSGRAIASVACVVMGSLLVLKHVWPWPGNAVMSAVGLSAVGSAFLWTHGGTGESDPFSRLASRMPVLPAQVLAGHSRRRVAAGGMLVLGGMSIGLAANTPFTSMRTVTIAVIVTIVGLGLILGPWMYQLAVQLSAERRERIRQEERAEVAAHLHDSVLQTLAMIQRSASPQDMASLARVQERELRAWLYGRRNPDDPQTLTSAIDEMAGRIERTHHVAVETVVVGDAPLDDGLRALIDATAEATTNAARHAGVTGLSVYAEVTDAEITIYVRDEGTGFDTETLPADRHGIADSIIGRMARNGGTATIRSKPQEGTEVNLVLPRRRS